MRKMIEHCPGCGGPLTVSRMDCGQCHTRIEGAFRPSAFDHLSPESLAFIELFVRLKGNLKEMERELGVPYSTVRHRLDEVVRELGPTQDTAPTTDDASSDEASSEERQKILDRLQKGDITPDEAIKQLEGAE